MAERIRARIRPQAEQLRRLAVVFAVELRLKIVTELYLRQMSPKQFHEEFGGGSLSRVSRNFDRLTETGWLRLIRSEGPGGDRRGGVEHFYRATELMFFDQATWARLPYSVRVAFSWNLFSQIGEQLRNGVEAEMVAMHRGSRLDSRSLRIDRSGQELVIAAVADAFASIFEAQRDARSRVAGTGETLTRFSVLQLAYESPTEGTALGRPGQLVEMPEPLISLHVRASRVFADEICMEIIEAANERTISATEFHREFGGDLGQIRRRFRKVAENGWLKEVEWKTGGRRRGATEKFYRATRPAFVKIEELLADLPPSVRETEAGRSMRRICTDFVEAMRSETVDARTDRCVALSFVELDTEGLKKVTTVLRNLWALILEVQNEAEARLEESGEEPIAMTVALGIYETPKSSRKEP